MGINVLCLVLGIILGALSSIIIYPLLIRGNYYYYKGKQYVIVSEGKIQSPNGPWRDCIHYKSTLDGRLYVREAEQFYKLFKTIEQVDEEDSRTNRA